MPKKGEVQSATATQGGAAVPSGKYRDEKIGEYAIEFFKAWMNSTKQGRYDDDLVLKSYTFGKRLQELIEQGGE